MPKEARLSGENEAAVLHMPNLVNHLLKGSAMDMKLFEEQEKCEYETKYYDVSKKKVLEMKGRYNTAFDDEDVKGE